jgi:hypothetical protein
MGTTLENLKSIIRYFAVPKGEEDIRIVYDTTASSLNDCVWAPSFWLPTIDSLLQSLDTDSWMAERDISDMFLNFELHPSAWPFAGVDIAPILEPEELAQVSQWYHWVCNLMGFKPSPWSSIYTALVAEEVIRGKRLDEENPFQWEKVVLNPLGPSYVPTKAWVSKVHKDSSLACDLFTFVDDECITGAGEELTWQACHTLGAKQAYLGIQDAARKVGEPSQNPRAWADVVVHVVSKLGVCVLTLEEKWIKLRMIIEKYIDLLLAGAVELDHKDLLLDCCFLVYDTRAYPGMIPYLKGSHLLTIGLVGTVDDEEAELAYLMRKKTSMMARAPSSGPTPIAPHLLADLRTLKALTESPVPPLQVVRPTKVVQVLYGFANASGKGLGSTVQGYPSRSLSQNPSNLLSGWVSGTVRQIRKL